jgi:hypothetical protein
MACSDRLILKLSHCWKAQRAHRQRASDRYRFWKTSSRSGNTAPNQAAWAL